jgi:hypothetical protein
MIILWGTLMSRKGNQLREKAKSLRGTADNIRVVECRRISLELAATAEELADQWDAIEFTMARYLADRAAAK